MNDQPQTTTCRTCVTPIGLIESPTGSWWAHETHPADNHDAVPAAWVNGDELMEAIAAAVWEHCAGEGTSLVVDDPRNIAATAAAVARAAVPAVPVAAPPTDQAAEELAKHVTRAIFALKSPAPPGSQHYRSGWDDGLEAAMDAARDAVLRRLAAETPQPETQAEAPCSDPIEYGHEAALGELREEHARAEEVLARVYAIVEPATRNVQRPAARLARRVLAVLPTGQGDACPPRCPCHRSGAAAGSAGVQTDGEA